MKQPFIFKDKDSPIQIFCPEKYKGYYIRGQIQQLSHSIYDKIFPEGYARAVYHLTYLALVKDAYAKKYLNEAGYKNCVGEFEGRTVDEFIKIRKDNLKKICKNPPEGLSIEQHLDQILKNDNDPIVLNIKDIAISETPYLINSLKDKAEIILLRISINLDRVELPSDNSLITYPKHIYHLPAYHLSTDCPYYDNEFVWEIKMFPGMLTECPGIISDDLSFKLYDQRRYSSYPSVIGDIAWEWLERRSLSQKGLEILNFLYKELKNKEDPYKEHYFSYLTDLITDLKDNKIIGQCLECSDFFQYALSKKRCNFKFEGKDCVKKASNNRHYSKNKDKILPKARLSTKKYRDS